MAGTKPLLNVTHLDEVLTVLEKYLFDKTKYYQLGLKLGLLAPTLDVIRAENVNDFNGGLMECLKKWLSQADNVESKGVPSYYTLIAALRAIGENAVAGGIDMHPACAILANHQSDQSLQESLPSLALFLHKEGIIKERKTRGTQVLLTAVQEAVYHNYENLKKFGAILQLFPATVSVGNAILEDYRKEYNSERIPESVKWLQRQLQPLLLEDVQKKGKELGRRSYGVVYEVTVSGLQCAGKKLHEILVEDGGDVFIDKFGQECLLHSQQRHPNIVQLMGIHYLPCAQLPLLVMEYLPMSLAQCLNKHQKACQDLPLQIKYSILLDVAKGLNYLHRKRPPIVHRDLSANNILLTNNYVAKISDLIMSRMIGTYKHHQAQTLSMAPGTTSVMPPEALKDNPTYDHKLDVFSYGCLVLHVFSQQWPIPTNEYVPSTTIKGMFKKVPEWERRSMYAAKIPKHNLLFRQLSKSCLEDEPEKRPEINYVLECTQRSFSACPPLKNILELMNENTTQLEQLQKEKKANAIALNEKYKRELNLLEENYSWKELRQSVQEKEKEIVHLKLSLAEKHEENEKLQSFLMKKKGETSAAIPVMTSSGL